MTVPGDRRGLLEDTRIRYMQTRTRAENLFARVSVIVHGNVRSAEDAIGHLNDLGERVYKEREKAFEEKKQKAYENVKVKGGKGTEL
ncbi:hypothetical protein BD779DRAFT_1677515 [Infundibulicybe gibba]|nr:hypothetical protein BD779DRAFT_1677515 [Infundibulicybe gibba]